MEANNNVKALKSGVWYTAANFLTKSIGFITTPIFTRLLSQTEYGLFSNFASWLSAFSVFATLNLGSSFISARFDFDQDFDRYVFSSLVLSSIVTAIWAAVINFFPSYFSSLSEIDIHYINIMIVYLLFYSAVDMFQMRERYYFKYKTSVLTSVLISISTAILSLFLVLNFTNRLTGRILGSALPTIIVGFFLYFVLLWRGQGINFSYWQYALPICLPYIPHLLSLSLLNSLDKMMITKICGARENALYSVAYTCGAVITMLITSLNTAFAPWLGEKLNEEKYEEIRKVSQYYLILFVFSTCGIMLLTPELLMILGGRHYSEAVYVMPPVAFGCVCQFMYTLYVNVEQFKKKTIGMAFASVVAVFINYILNSIFIPSAGYIAAAYTTLASFAILLFIHMLLVKNIGLQRVYSTKAIILTLGFMSVYTVLIHFLYLHTILRYSLFSVYAISACYLVYKYKSGIIKLIKHRD